MDEGQGISPSDWMKGILLSILASIIGGISKLAIRHSWLMEEAEKENHNYTTPETFPANNNDLLSTNDTTDSTRINHEQLIIVAEVVVVEATDSNTNTDSVNANATANADQDEDEEHWKPSFVWSKFLRGCGMVGMSVLNPICCVLAMNYASPSILAPFSGLTLVWVILFSPLVNKEQPTSRQIFACSLIIAGEVIVAIFGDHTNDEGITVAEVQASYKKTAFIFYCFGLMSYLTVMTYWINFSKSFLLRRFAWGCSGGAITGLQNFLKDSLTIIKAVNIDRQQQQKQQLPWIFYILFLSAASTAFIGLLILTACMKRYDATYSAASFVGSFVVSASIMAAVKYNTFVDLEGILNYVLYPFGIAILMIGVYVLVRESTESYGHDESVNQRRQHSVNGGETEFDLEHDIFDYTEVSETAREETTLV